MMGALRDKKFMKFVLWTIVVVFVGFIFLAWGMQITGVGAPKDPNAAARVGKRVIAYSEFYQRYQPVLDRLYSERGESLSEDSIRQLQMQVLDNMVDDAVILQTADRMGIVVSTDEVAETIRQERYFFDENGRFDPNRYAQVLQKNNMTPAQFEESQRQNLLIQKIQVLLSGSVLITPGDLKAYADLLNRDLRAVYTVLDPKQFASSLTFGTRDLEDYYESHRDRYDRPERAKLRHILLSLREGATPQEADVIQKTLEDYRSQVISGKTRFEDLAKKYSQDENSKKDGGNLGWITRGLTVPEFEEAAFALKKGALSKPLRTKYGYHLIKLDDYEPAYQSTIQAVRGKVTEDYRRDSADRKVQNLIAQLGGKRESGETLKKAADRLKLASGVTPWLKRGNDIPGIQDSKRMAESLSELHLNEWRGPLGAGSKQYFFQIAEERENPVSDERMEKDRQDLTDRLTSAKKNLRLKQFLAEEKKRMDVKIYLNREKDGDPGN